MKLKSTIYTGRQLLNPARPYVHSTKTNVAETFERIRKEQAEQEKMPHSVIKFKAKK